MRKRGDIKNNFRKIIPNKLKRKILRDKSRKINLTITL